MPRTPPSYLSSKPGPSRATPPYVSSKRAPSRPPPAQHPVPAKAIASVPQVSLTELHSNLYCVSFRELAKIVQTLKIRYHPKARSSFCAIKAGKKSGSCTRAFKDKYQLAKWVHKEYGVNFSKHLMQCNMADPVLHVSDGEEVLAETTPSPPATPPPLPSSPPPPRPPQGPPFNLFSLLARIEKTTADVIRQRLEQFYTSATNQQMLQLAETEDLHYLNLTLWPTTVTSTNHWGDLTDLHAYASLTNRALAIFPIHDLPCHIFPVYADGTENNRALLLDTTFWVKGKEFSSKTEFK